MRPSRLRSGQFYQHHYPYNYLLLPATGVISYFEDQYMDVTVVLIVCFLFGPLLALVAYLIVGAIKQEMNVALPVLLIGQFIVRTVLPFSITGVTGGVSLMTYAEYGIFMQALAVFTTFVGWFMGSFLRPLNR